MNAVQIRGSHFSNKIEVLINGEPLSQYSDFSSKINRPFIESAKHIIKGLDAEIFDDYSITCELSEFQFETIQSEARKSEYCKIVELQPLQTSLSSQQIYHELMDLCHSNGLEFEDVQPIKVFSSSDNYYIPRNPGYVTVENAIADVGIVSSEDIDISSCNTRVIIGNEIGIRTINGRNFFSCPEDKLSLFWSYYDETERITPHISECLTAIKYKKLNDIDKMHLSAITSGTDKYYLSKLPSSFDQGETINYLFKSFPTDKFHIESSNSGILSISSDKMLGVSEGNANVLVKNDSGKVIETVPLHIVGHIYVSSIRMIPRFEYLKVNEKNHIDVVTSPLNAEDEKMLNWESSDEGVLQIDNKGNVFALRTGKAFISVHSKETQASIEVEVKPSLTALHIRQSSIRLKPGETIILDSELVPQNAQADNLHWEIDNRTIATINQSKDGRRCQVTALSGYEGKGNIRCTDAASKLSAICNVEVISKVKPNGLGKAALVCWLLGIILPFLLPISAGVSIYGIAKDPEPDHKGRYIICAIGSIITLLFWMSLAGQ